jgi:hypothetical protein
VADVHGSPPFLPPAATNPTTHRTRKGTAMSPFLFSADHANSDLGVRFRTSITVAEALTMSVSEVFAEYAEARRSGDPARMAAVRDYAALLDAELADELDGFDYPAAA